MLQLTQYLQNLFKEKNNRFVSSVESDQNLINAINNFVPGNISFREKIALSMHGKQSVPKCVCGKQLIFGGRFLKPYNTYCSEKCSVGVNKNKKQQETKLEKFKVGYDFSNINNRIDLKKLILKVFDEKKTNALLYLKNNEGLISILNKSFQGNDIIEKIAFIINDINEPSKCKNCGKNLKFTGRCKAPYNVSGFCSLKCSNSSQLTKDKSKETYIKTFGVDHNMKSSEFKEKFKGIIGKRNDLIGKKKEVQGYLTEGRLGLFLKNNFSNIIDQFPKNNKLLANKYGIDSKYKNWDYGFEYNGKLYLVEFDGFIHYQKFDQINLDMKYDQYIKNKSNVILIRIPYFIQLNNITFSLFFGINKIPNFLINESGNEINLNLYPNGFISKEAKTKYHFDTFHQKGKKRFYRDLLKFPQSVISEILVSLGKDFNWFNSLKNL